MARDRFIGLCAGGPNDGRKLEGGHPTVRIAIQRPVKPQWSPGEPTPLNIASGEYIFKDAIGMWIWKGKWPPK